jgi:hypothetical protein
VQILTPANGTSAPINRPFQVNAIAQGISMIARIELYADGALVATDETTLPEGTNPLIFLKGLDAADHGPSRFACTRVHTRATHLESRRSS